MPPSPQSPNPEDVNPGLSRDSSAGWFFLLVFAFSLPLWLLGVLSSSQVLPGLPVGSIAILVPMLAASILVYRQAKLPGVVALLKRSFDFKRVHLWIWYLPALLLMPGVMVLSYYVMRWMGSPVPPPQFSVLAALGMLVAFFLAGLGEEMGWTGYALDRLQARYSALVSSMILGLVGSLWHIVLLVQVGRSPTWMAWWALGTVAQRVLMVWLYNNAGKSLFIVALTHAMSNLSWQLFPIEGSYYDPQVTGLITALIALLVTLVWGPATLVRSRPVSTPGA